MDISNKKKKNAITHQKGQQKGHREKWSFGKCRSPAEPLKKNHSKGEMLWSSDRGFLIMILSKKGEILQF